MSAKALRHKQSRPDQKVAQSAWGSEWEKGEVAVRGRGRFQ